MTSHSWYEDPPWPHWQELCSAERYISNYVYKWSRCRLISKEKYGTIRYQWLFPPGGRCFNVSGVKLPFISMDVECEKQKIHKKYYLGNKGKYKVVIWRWADSWLYRKWEYFGWCVTARAIKNAKNLFPNVKEEIEDDFIWQLED